MPGSTGKHLRLEDGRAIEEGLRDGSSAGAIAERIGASPSTVTREVKANRTLKERRGRPGASLSVRCAKRSGCERVGSACEGCASELTRCRDCRTRQCIEARHPGRLSGCALDVDEAPVHLIGLSGPRVEPLAAAALRVGGGELALCRHQVGVRGDVVLDGGLASLVTLARDALEYDLRVGDVLGQHRHPRLGL